MSWLALTLVGLIILVVLVLPQLRSNDVGALVAERDLHAGDVLREDDVKLGVRQSSNEHDFVTHAVGRLAVHEIEAGAPVRARDVGLDVAGLLGRDADVVAVEGRSAAALGDVIRTGNGVRLILQRRGRKPVSLDGVVLARQRPGRTALAVAMRRSAANRYLRMRSRWSVTVVRTLLGPR